MNRTDIPYGDYHWAPVEGCWGPHGTSGRPRRCKGCWAQRLLKRIGAAIGCELCVEGVPHVHPERWDQPTPRQKPAEVLVAFRSDLFGVATWAAMVGPDGVRERADIPAGPVLSRVVEQIEACPQHKFVMLTRYPENIPAFDWPKNTYHGVTVTNQAEADELIPKLLAAEVPHPWVSMEPMRGDIRMPVRWRVADRYAGQLCLQSVIVGGQSGPGAAPMELDWVRSARDQCAEACVPFAFKQWAAANPGETVQHAGHALPLLDGRVHWELPWRLT